MIAGLLAAVLAGQAVAAGDAFAELLDVAIGYYDIDGDDAATIRAAMNAVRPTDGNDGARVDALTHCSMRWRWQGDGQGGCDLASAVVTARAEVTLPRLSHPEAVPADVLARWDTYRAALATIKAHDLVYDRETRRGRTQGAVFP